MAANGIEHAIGEKYNAPQATLMATLIKGLLSFNLDWQFVLAGCFIAVTMELCGIKSLSFAVGLYLPLATTLPIWIGGVIRGFADFLANRGKDKKAANGDHGSADDELSKGSLLATGLVAGGALAGVVIALLSVDDRVTEFLKGWNLEGTVGNLMSPLMQTFGIEASHAGEAGYQIFGVLCFAAMGAALFMFARKK